uniref:HMA domain-containing protein n=2 Tax=Calcidiscus leptoporus TaxID=127549 RepID=A0A7S0II79_9EUKA|mmetsp:Transcript_10355/g.23990  ORF Transcript_10355/g.23990 Transcript_10355/m.23990 type:complete len:133 (+) Transcript_10355:33-431(+)
MWHAVLANRGQLLVSALSSSILTCALSFLPEALHWYVHRGRAPLPATHRLHMHVSGMGCTACSAKVKSTLEAISGIAESEVHFESGVVQLKVQASVNCALVMRLAVEALAKAGFTAEALGPDHVAAAVEGQL